MVQNRRSFLGHLPVYGAFSLPAERLAPASDLEAGLGEQLDQVPIVNTHEHIIPEEERVRQSVDFFTLAGHYAINDVISAGISRGDLEVVRDPEASQLERWRAFEPFWKYALFTGYGQALRLALRDIYDIQELSQETLPLLNERIAAANQPGLYQKILVEKAGIRFSVLDDYWNAKPVPPDPRYFVYARKFDRFVTPATPKEIEQLGELTGTSITGLQGLKRALRASFQESLEAGMVTVKTTIAYQRDLHFEEVNEADASRAFEALMAEKEEFPRGFRGRQERPFRALEDHLFHYLIQTAGAYEIPVQIHTGLHAGNGNFISNSNPTLLTNLFFLYPEVQFDLFHISYPYQGELSVLAKIFQNVFVDFCWAHIISASVSRSTLHEMLETVPANKIFGFGGDYRYPELTYAHAVIARKNIARVLAEKVEEGFCSEKQASEIGTWLLHDNPARLFNR